MNRKFLLIDDDADDTELFSEALQEIDATLDCTVAENGIVAFELLAEDAEHLPGLIFLDINMPKMNGWTCLEKLKDSPVYSSIPVLMYSTSSAQKDIEMAYSLGADLFITKPDNFDVLSKLLRCLIEEGLENRAVWAKAFRNIRENR